MSAFTTHVLDTSRGSPAAGVPVLLERRLAEAWRQLGEGVTDDDGRCADLLPDGDALETGTYRLTFDTAAHWLGQGVAAFHPRVVIEFVVADDRHHHVPLLLSPFGYTTYRGS